MHKEVLANIDGVSLFPVIAIVLFMIIFSLITYYTIKMDKRKIGELSFIPLEDDPTSSLPTHSKTQN
ncbi:MAG: CcoQ/FixQ family Cbb3-type cytochrome c oxidase assembly chaperone [Bacteroidota bacterium]